jgi:hypothetical protein
MTVGSGIAPDHAFRLADFTAGGDFHPALKIVFNYEWIIHHYWEFVKGAGMIVLRTPDDPTAVKLHL